MLQNLYPHLRGFHSLFRWLLLLFALAAIIVALSGWGGHKAAGPGLLRLGLIYVLAMDLELITGLLLYLGVSSASRSGFTFHAIIMFLAVIFAHVGGALTRKAPTEASKHRGAAIAWLISLFLIFAAIPRP